MSIYHPPSKTQGVFNPSNFGGLGTGGQITTDYLDANYLQFPVSQGNATLVGTSVLGDITQQGDFSTTGDLLVNDVNIITEIGTKQDTIEDGDLTIAKTDGLQSELTTLDTDVTAINTNNLIYNSDEYGIKTVSKWESRTIPEEGTWRKIVYSPELNLFVSIRLATENSIMTSTNGIVWESVINDLGGCRDIVWAGGEVGKFVIAHFALPGFSTSTDGKNWISTDFQVASGNICITYSPDLNIFVSVDNTGGVVKSIDGGLIWASISTPPNTNFPKSIVWSSELNIFVIVYRTGAERVAYSSNGDDWVNVIVSLNEWNDIAWSPQLELFVAVADTGDNRVMTSTDGISWIDGTIPLYLWESVEWSELGFFIATAKDGYILYSSDGFNWADSELTGSLYGGCWSKELGIFVIVGNDTIYTSSLKNRKPTNENIFNNEFNSIDEDGTWTFNSLNTNLITLPTIGDVETTIQGKQDTIEDGDLTIANTNGLQTALDNKYDDTGGTIDGSVTITSDLVVGSTNIITELGSNTNNLSSIQTQVDSLIDIFSQGISFRAYSLSSATISSGQNLPFDNESYDSQGTYDTTTNVYTIDIAGTYLFSFGWFVVEGSTASINLIRKRSGTETIIQQSTNGSYTGNNTSFFLATIDECEKDDEIYAYLSGGSCRLAQSDLTEPNNNSSFSGSRLSS